MEFYFQIKGKGDNIYGGRWAWPPLFSGKVEADNKKEARKLIEEDFGRSLPMRVSSDDEEASFLLHITSMTNSLDRLFEDRFCEVCNNDFRRIDLYNDQFESYKGESFCSSRCHEIYREEQRQLKFVGGEMEGRHRAVIYGICNIQTKQWYIGKTTQAFTLRWYQHFYQSGDTKFHQEVKTTPVEDWEFRVLEMIDPPKDIDLNKFIASREAFWIEAFNSIDNGYNTLSAQA